MLLIMMIFMTGCAKSNNIEADGQEEEVVKYEQLLSVDQLITLSGIDQNKYANMDLEQFIEDYEITMENVKTLNISLLLQDYDENTEQIDVSDIFNASFPARKANYTDDIVAIAYYENKGTSSECVYYDLLNNCRYRTTDSYLFSNLNQLEAEVYTEGRQLILQLDELGIFTWTDISDKDDLEDAQTMVIAIKYSDNTVFKISAEGILVQVLPKSYVKVKELLLN